MPCLFSSNIFVLQTGDTYKLSFMSNSFDTEKNGQNQKTVSLNIRVGRCQEIIINWPIILLRLVLAHQSNDYYNISYFYHVYQNTFQIPRVTSMCTSVDFFVFLVDYLNESTYICCMCVGANGWYFFYNVSNVSPVTIE